MINIEQGCLDSLAHLIRDEDELVKRSMELDKNPNIKRAINAIVEGLMRRNDDLEESLSLSAFLMYNLIRIQIESNDLK